MQGVEEGRKEFEILESLEILIAERYLSFRGHGSPPRPDCQSGRNSGSRRVIQLIACQTAGKRSNGDNGRWYRGTARIVPDTIAGEVISLDDAEAQTLV